MKLFKKIALATTALVLGVSLASCHKKPDPEPEITRKTIAEVLQQDNATQANTKGVVFAKTTDGIYVNDGTASIFVSGGTTAKVKDEVTIDGNFVLANKMPKVNNPTVTVVESNKAELQPTVKSVVEIAGLDANTRTNYGLYYTVSGALSKNAFNQYLLEKDGSTLFINEKSNTSALANWTGKEVTLDVITTSKSSEGWTVSYCKEATDVIEVPVDLEAVKAEIFEYVQGKIPTNVYGALNLVKAYDNIPNVTLTWSVKEAGTISITNNVATVTMPETDTQVTLVLTLGNGVTTVTHEYTVTNKAIRQVAIADLATTPYEKKENIIVEGTVILTTRSNGTIFSNFIMDDEGQHFARIDSSEEECQQYHVGDKIKVLGNFKVSNGIQCIDAVSIEVTEASTSNVVNWANLASTTLETEADYVAIADLIDSEEGMPLTLFKIVNPYITTSASSGYNYLRFGPTLGSAKSGVTAADKTKNTASMSLSAMDFTLGANVYDTLFNYGNYSDDAVKNVGLTMYAFCGFNIEAKTTGQFVFAKEAIVKDLKAGIDAEIESYTVTINASEAGEYALPKEIGGVNITWTTACPTYHIETGTYDIIEETGTYVFTAKYTIDSVEYTKDIQITFEAAEPVYLTVSQFNDQANTTVCNVEGTIIAFATANPDSNAQKVVYGLYISDGNEIAYISETGLHYDSTIKNGYEATYTYTVTTEYDTKFAIGDVIRVQKATKSSTGVEITNSSKITVTPKGDVETPITFNPTTFETVSSKKDMADVFAQGTHILVKVVALDSNPLCLGSSKVDESKYPGSTEVCVTNKIRIYFYENTPTQSTTTIKVDGTHTVATKAIASELNLGHEWWKTLGDPNFALNTSNTKTDHKFVGSFYCVLTITSGSFYMITLIPDGFDLSLMPE